MCYVHELAEFFSAETEKLERRGMTHTTRHRHAQNLIQIADEIDADGAFPAITETHELRALAMRVAE